MRLDGGQVIVRRRSKSQDSTVLEIELFRYHVMSYQKEKCVSDYQMCLVRPCSLKLEGSTRRKADNVQEARL